MATSRERNEEIDLVLRLDLHIVRTSRGWLLQNSGARTLRVFRTAEAALEYAEATARQIRIVRGLNVRLSLHPPGRATQIFDFPARIAPAESYALKFCRLS